jgi:ATP synthase protein I
LSGDGHQKKGKHFAEEVGAKETRKMEARKRKEENLWFGLGMFGLVGWSVAIPTLIGVAIGAWIDMNYPTRFSWTLMLMVIGVLLGCINAWYWVSRFDRRA